MLDPKEIGTTSSEFVLNRMVMQGEHLATIAEKFDGQVRAVLPLFERDVRGVEMLRRLGSVLFALMTGLSLAM